MRKRALVLLPVLFGALMLVSQTAEAQYYGRGGYGGGYGYGPQPQPQWGFRHRVHGYFGGELTGIATLGQTASHGYLGRGGGGGGLFGGVRMGPFFSLELNWNITWHQVADDTYWSGYWSAFHLQTVELNGKVHIPTRGMIEPYFQAGVGFAFLGTSWEDRWSGYGEDYIFSSGVCFNLGGGFDVWLGPFFSLGARVLYKGMRFGDGTVLNGNRYDTNYTSAVNVDANITLHF